MLTQVLAHTPKDLAALRLLHRIDEARVSAPQPDWCSALALDKL